MKKVGNTYPKNTQGATYKTVSLRLEINIFYSYSTGIGLFPLNRCRWF